MHAAVLHAPHDLRVEERPDPLCAPDQVVIEVSLNGLCGTDATEWSKGPMMVPLATRHPGSGHLGPTILGHEFIGTVVEAGSEVTGWLGARVASGAGVSCGSCPACRNGRTNLCATYYTLGLSTHGGLAQYVAAPARTLTRVPDGLLDVDAALAQPLAVGLHAVARAGVRPGHHVVLLGAGAIGAFVLAGLSGHDGRVTVLDVDPARLDLASELGATDVHLIDRGVTPAELRASLASGADVVIECSGVPGSAARALALAERGGIVLLVGLTKAPQELELADLVLRELDVRGTVAHVCDVDLPAALALLESRPLSGQLVQEVIGLDDVVSRGLDPLARGTASGKVLVAPSV